MRPMPNLTKDQLRRLKSAAETIQRVVRELETAEIADAVRAEPVVRYASVPAASSAGTLGDDVIVAGEPE